ncbi:MAG: hypothetical protein HOO67_01690 [Candidatus Peribacteraceae bacterium]|nr:hypothetical protein [Candidatus Peribacteraceae bacterium]
MSSGSYREEELPVAMHAEERITDPAAPQFAEGEHGKIEFRSDLVWKLPVQSELPDGARHYLEERLAHLLERKLMEGAIPVTEILPSGQIVLRDILRDPSLEETEVLPSGQIVSRDTSDHDRRAVQRALTQIFTELLPYCAKALPKWTSNSLLMGNTLEVADKRIKNTGNSVQKFLWPVFGGFMIMGELGYMSQHDATLKAMDRERREEENQNERNQAKDFMDAAKPFIAAIVNEAERRWSVMVEERAQQEQENRRLLRLQSLVIGDGVSQKLAIGLRDCTLSVDGNTCKLCFTKPTVIYPVCAGDKQDFCGDAILDGVTVDFTCPPVARVHFAASNVCPIRRGRLHPTITFTEFSEDDSPLIHRDAGSGVRAGRPTQGITEEGIMK